jgi:hypothetical protein
MVETLRSRRLYAGKREVSFHLTERYAKRFRALGNQSIAEGGKMAKKELLARFTHRDADAAPAAQHMELRGAAGERDG